MTDADKYILLHSIYDDMPDGYDATQATYNRANKAMPRITYEYVNNQMAKQKQGQA